MSFTAFGLIVAVLGVTVWLFGAELGGVFMMGVGLGFALAGLAIHRRLT